MAQPDPDEQDAQRPWAAGAPSSEVPLLDEEPEQHVPGSFLESLPQFFVFPAILVVTLTAAYLGLRLLVGGESSDSRELLAEVRNASGRHGRWQALYSLADGLRTGRLSLEPVSAAELETLYADVADDGAQERQFMLEVLGWKPDPSLRPLVVGALQDPEPEVRMAALAALAHLHDPATVPALVAVLAEGQGLERFLALGALARIGDTAARDAIAGQIGGGDSVLHRNAVLALAQAGDARAAAWLPALLDRDNYAADSSLDGEDAALRDESSRAAARESVVEQFLVSACRAAAHTNDSSLRPLLESLSSNDPSLKVRSAAISALADLGAPENS